MLKVITVDDEPHANEALAAVLGGIEPKVEVVKTCSNTKEASAAIISHRPDLVFLDVIMPEETGIEFLRRLDKFDFEVIFVTAHDKYALDAIRLSALDYIVKPIRASDVQAAVNKAIGRHEVKQKLEHYAVLYEAFEGVRKHIMLPTKNGMYELVKFEEILYCKADRHLTYFFLSDGRKLTSGKNIGEYKTILAEVNFLQPHQSYMVNTNAIQGYNAGDQILKLKNKEEIPISMTYKDRIIAWLKNKG